MTNRECFHAACRIEPVGQFCHMEHGFWDETYDRFRKEGLPETVTKPEFACVSRGDLFDYFHILKCGYIRPEIYMQPPLPVEVLEEDDDSRVVRNGNGAVLKLSKQGASLPQEIDHLIKDRESYARYRDRLIDPCLDVRCGKAISEIIDGYKMQEDYAAVCTHMDGFFAYPRELMGVVDMLLQFYDDPEFMHQLLDDRANFYIQVYTPILEQIRPDFAFLWEDMCFKNGPLLSPDLFREFLLPAYRKVISFLHDYGVNNVIVDSDGDVTKLIPLWLEAGVTGLLPFEVQSGMDVVELGKAFPQLLIIGGINKFRLFGSREEIDAELDRVLPAMAKRGGYIPTLDHWVPPEISLDNFRYYTEKIRNFRR